MRGRMSARAGVAASPWHLVGLALVALGSAWLALSWEPAGRASPDSAFYLEGARHPAAGQGFTTSRVPVGATERLPITLHPPEFSWCGC